MLDKYIGKRLDKRYEIKELLGVGGMAVVYSAFDIFEKRTVAIKILKDEFLDNKDFMRRFKNESRTIAMLSHPNIVKIFDVSLGDKIQYIVMEYVDGITLKDFIERQKRVKWKDAIFFVGQILSALSHAHSKGIIHRDIKPQNIMLLRDGTIKVTDFGIAKFLSYETRTLTDKTIGSVHYISPEQAKGDITDERTDIYSIGVLLYEMLTGRLPFEADNAVSVAIMQLQSRPKPLREINETIPEGLEEITLKAMQKSSEFRFKTADEMLTALGEFKKNPSIRFEYKYFISSDEPTRYMKIIDSVKAAKERNNTAGIEDNNNLLHKKKKVSKPLSVIIGIGIVVLIFVFVLVMGLFTGWFGLSGKDVDVPSFVGMKASDVIDGNDYKFKWIIEYAYDSLKPEGIIIDQEPKAGSKKIKEDSEVKLVVNSSGATIKVPNLKGKTEDKAKTALKDAGFLCEVSYAEDEETPKGVVISTEPAAGKEVAVSSTVKLFVSKGPALKNVTVPNVIGKPLNDAINEITSKGLKVSSEVNKEKSNQPKDMVTAVNPPPGTEVKEGSSVSLTVSSGEAVQKNVSIDIDLPTDVNRDVSLKVYVGGELCTSKTIRPSLVGTYTITVSGSGGKKSVNVNLDDKLYRKYEIDFDAGSVTKISSYTFTSTSVNNNNNNITKVVAVKNGRRK